ncbi:MAG: hypothetical protein BMS9Abin05_0427 [Rhodothermia bacterium]|nr:MAG: hypothetical protein BMS9Abin05_0427 [Rhodothermia bacterium]
MKRMNWIVLLPLGLLLTACQTSPESDAISTEADVESLTELISQYDAVVNARDVEAFLAFYTDNAVRMIPNEPVFIGKASFESRAIEGFSNTEEDLRSTIEEIHVSGDWASMRLSYTDTYTPSGADSPIDEIGKWLILFERQEDGSWKMATEIWNVDTQRK